MNQGVSTAITMRGEFRAMLALAWPLALANLLQMAVYAVDVIFLARLGETPLAAASLAMAVFGSMVWGFQGFVGGSAPLIAAELGRKAHSVREVRRTVRMALWHSILSGGLGFGLCFLAGPLMRATGQDPDVVTLAEDFILLLSFSIIPMVAASVLRIFVAALGRPIFATAITALAIGVNALGNWLLVFGNFGFPKLGMFGSAVSTFITAVAMVIAYVVAIQADPRLRRFHLFGRFWRPEWTQFRAIARIGFPISLTVIAEGGLFNSAAFIMGRIGTAELAAHTIALQIIALFFQIPFGVAQAATIRVAYHRGAGQPLGVSRAGWAAIATCIGFELVSAAVLLFKPLWPITIYLDPNAVRNATVVALTVQLLIVGAAFQLFDGLQTVAAGVLRGLEDTRVPMIIAICGYWLAGFTCAIWLGIMTPLAHVGVWIGLMVGLVVVSAFLIHRWTARERLGLQG